MRWTFAHAVLYNALLVIAQRTPARLRVEFKVLHQTSPIETPPPPQELNGVFVSDLYYPFCGDAVLVSAFGLLYD